MFNTLNLVTEFVDYVNVPFSTAQNKGTPRHK